MNSFGIGGTNVCILCSCIIQEKVTSAIKCFSISGKNHDMVLGAKDIFRSCAIEKGIRLRSSNLIFKNRVSFVSMRMKEALKLLEAPLKEAARGKLRCKLICGTSIEPCARDSFEKPKENGIEKKFVSLWQMFKFFFESVRAKIICCDSGATLIYESLKGLEPLPTAYLRWRGLKEVKTYEFNEKERTNDIIVSFGCNVVSDFDCNISGEFDRALLKLNEYGLVRNFVRGSQVVSVKSPPRLEHFLNKKDTNSVFFRAHQLALSHGLCKTSAEKKKHQDVNAYLATKNRKKTNNKIVR